MTAIVEGTLDHQCVALVQAMNRLEGVETTSSCCGHGEAPYRIWFRVTDYHGKGLADLARLTCERYHFDISVSWQILLNHGDLPGEEVGFLLEGTDWGPEQYKKALDLATEINRRIDARENKTRPCHGYYTSRIGTAEGSETCITPCAKSDGHEGPCTHKGG